MAELLLELYSEEIPPQLQIAARSQIKQFFEKSLKEFSIYCFIWHLAEICNCGGISSLYNSNKSSAII